jgi:hypothetical protein
MMSIGARISGMVRSSLLVALVLCVMAGAAGRASGIWDVSPSMPPAGLVPRCSAPGECKTLTMRVAPNASPDLQRENHCTSPLFMIRRSASLN